MWGTTRLAYCPDCEAKREVHVTVAWQADLCSRCGSDVERLD